MSDLISRQAAIDALDNAAEQWDIAEPYHEGMRAGYRNSARLILSLPSAQPEQPTGVQDILQYLDEYLHPIVSPEHWSVYSELYDMVSMLPSAHPEIIYCRECKCWDTSGYCIDFMTQDEDGFCKWAERRTDETN